jgi:hypothetical protein
MAEAPVITVSLDMDEGVYRLMASSYGRTTPAGVRLFHAAPHPDIKFEHADEASALHDAAALTAYIESTWKQAPSRTKLRREGA